MEKNNVDTILRQLDFSIHDILATTFDAIQLVQRQFVNESGSTKKRIVIACMNRLVTQIKDDDELREAQILLTKLPSLIDMSISLTKNKIFRKQKWLCCF